jgi:hypothetical protein
MAKTNTIPQIQNADRGAAIFQNADGNNTKLLYAASVDDTLIESILCASDDSADRLVQLILSDGVNSYVLDTIKVTAGYGTDGTNPAVDLLANSGLPVNSQGKRILKIKNGTSLSAKILGTAVTATKTVTVNAFVGNF